MRRKNELSFPHKLILVYAEAKNQLLKKLNERVDNFV